jgi:hypothetical protein
MVHLLRTETAVALGSLITKRVPFACPVLTFAIRCMAVLDANEGT